MSEQNLLEREVSQGQLIFKKKKSTFSFATELENDFIQKCLTVKV